MSLLQDVRKVFTAQTLTGSYVVQASPANINIEGFDQVNLDVAYTMGTAETANSIQIKIEFANPIVGDPASTDWSQETSITTVSGVTTILQHSYTFDAVSAAGTYDRFQIAIPINSKYMRVSVKETGIAANGGTATIKAILRSENARI